MTVVQDERDAVFTADMIREVAMMALGRISLDLFQPGSHREGDWLRTRSGERIGYGELARRYALALDDELRSGAERS